MSTAPKVANSTAERSSSFRRLPWRNPREALTIEVVYRGGQEGFIEVRARGVVKRFPGHLALFDVMAEVWQWDKKGT
jgi:hypothetical protein